MKKIEALAHKISYKITQQLDLDDEKKAVIAYGLTGLLQLIALVLIVAIIGIIFGFFFEGMIILFSVGFMRKSTGGAHSKTMSGCNVVSVLSISFLAAISRYILSTPISSASEYIITFLVFGICIIVFYQRVPVDNIKKPIVNADKIKRLRKQSFYKLLFFFLMTVLLIRLTNVHERFYSIASSIKMAMIWQAITLTKRGEHILSWIDLNVNRILE
ncbi:accessory gene regulator ArgB-like protein [Proteiniclasticum sp. C24MP]|uniref:accessory gene regulator ArgB-like protein n=1 Tax=Proteiniclasticum sp. C24MP TaxID=3374101 RepID=UPI00375407C2